MKQISLQPNHKPLTNYLLPTLKSVRISDVELIIVFESKKKQPNKKQRMYNNVVEVTQVRALDSLLTDITDSNLKGGVTSSCTCPAEKR